ncbi:MAG: TlpA disulfide reductase family protein [Phycisphaerales bacterium]
MHSTVLRIVVAVAILLSPRAWAAPDDPVADPAAEKAFAEFVAAYRALPAVKVKTTVAVGAGEHGAESKGQPVEAELVHGVVGGKPDGARKGVFKLRGYTIWIGDGQIAAVHESNPDTYLRTPDGGSPFYALLSAFVDLPFPDLALAFGETDPTELVMQLNPKAPNVVPTAVVNEQVEGKERRTFKLTAEHESIDLVVDPATNLPQSMVVRITGGTLVPAGATLTYTHTFSYEIPKAPLAEADFAFDPGKRQKVDLMPALVKRPEPGAAGENGEPRHALVGKPLPPLLLPLLDDGVLDTAKMKGRVLVLDFWATWCGPCKAALPSLHQIAADFRRQDAPVSFYTVNVFEQE